MMPWHLAIGAIEWEKKEMLSNFRLFEIRGKELFEHWGQPFWKEHPLKTVFLLIKKNPGNTSGL
jgi:hypothetical protein